MNIAEAFKAAAPTMNETICEYDHYMSPFGAADAEALLLGQRRSDAEARGDVAAYRAFRKEIRAYIARRKQEDVAWLRKEGRL